MSYGYKYTFNGGAFHRFGVLQVMNDQRLGMYKARDAVIERDTAAMKDLALQYATDTCSEIVEG